LYGGFLRILGIDPGLKITGYGVIDSISARPALVGAGVIRLNARASIAERLAKLEKELEQLFDEFKPDACAVEKLYAHYKHPPTAILMGHARGIILLVAQKRGVRLEQYAANSIKQSLTGHGHASKAQMQRAIAAEWNLSGIPEPVDAADALAIALCCSRYIGSPVPAPRRRRLAKTVPA
jgi:crossover junction endodeoxyribonuclease RuvC